MASFDAQIDAALHSLEADVRERAGQWLDEVEKTAGSGKRSGMQLQPVHFTCRVPSAHFKDQAIVVNMPEWQLRRESVEVAVETYAAREAAGQEPVCDADTFGWTPLAEDCAGQWGRTTVAVSVPQLHLSPHEVIFRVPSLVMSRAQLRLDLPAWSAQVSSCDAAALDGLYQILRSAGLNAQARVAAAVASLFREAVSDLLNLRARTLAAIDAVARGPMGGLFTGSAPGGPEAAHPAQNGPAHAAAREAVIAAFGHEAEALDRHAVQLVSETLEGLALRLVDIGDGADARAVVIPLRHRLLGALRLQRRTDSDAPSRSAVPADPTPGQSLTPDDPATLRLAT